MVYEKLVLYLCGTVEKQQPAMRHQKLLKGRNTIEILNDGMKQAHSDKVRQFQTPVKSPRSEASSMSKEQQKEE